MPAQPSDNATNLHTVTLHGGPLHGQAAQVHDRQTILQLPFPSDPNLVCIYRPTLYLPNDWHFQMTKEAE